MKRKREQDGARQSKRQRKQRSANRNKYCLRGNRSSVNLRYVTVAEGLKEDWNDYILDTACDVVLCHNLSDGEESPRKMAHRPLSLHRFSQIALDMFFLCQDMFERRLRSQHMRMFYNWDTNEVSVRVCVHTVLGSHIDRAPDEEWYLDFLLMSLLGLTKLFSAGKFITLFTPVGQLVEALRKQQSCAAAAGSAASCANLETPGAATFAYLAEVMPLTHVHRIDFGLIKKSKRLNKWTASPQKLQQLMRRTQIVGLRDLREYLRTETSELSPWKNVHLQLRRPEGGCRGDLHEIRFTWMPDPRVWMLACLCKYRCDWCQSKMEVNISESTDRVADRRVMISGSDGMMSLDHVFSANPKRKLSFVETQAGGTSLLPFLEEMDCNPLCFNVLTYNTGAYAPVDPLGIYSMRSAFQFIDDKQHPMWHHIIWFSKKHASSKLSFRAETMAKRFEALHNNHNMMFTRLGEHLSAEYSDAPASIRYFTQLFKDKAANKSSRDAVRWWRVLVCDQIQKLDCAIHLFTPMKIYQVLQKRSPVVDGTLRLTRSLAQDPVQDAGLLIQSFETKDNLVQFDRCLSSGVCLDTLHDVRFEFDACIEPLDLIMSINQTYSQTFAFQYTLVDENSQQVMLEHEDEETSEKALVEWTHGHGAVRSFFYSLWEAYGTYYNACAGESIDFVHAKLVGGDDDREPVFVPLVQDGRVLTGRGGDVFLVPHLVPDTPASVVIQKEQDNMRLQCSGNAYRLVRMFAMSIGRGVNVNVNMPTGCTKLMSSLGYSHFFKNVDQDVQACIYQRIFDCDDPDEFVGRDALEFVHVLVSCSHLGHYDLNQLAPAAARTLFALYYDFDRYGRRDELGMVDSIVRTPVGALDETNLYRKLEAWTMIAYLRIIGQRTFRALLEIGKCFLLDPIFLINTNKFVQGELPILRVNFFGGKFIEEPDVLSTKFLEKRLAFYINDDSLDYCSSWFTKQYRGELIEALRGLGREAARDFFVRCYGSEDILYRNCIDVYLNTFLCDCDKTCACTRACDCKKWCGCKEAFAADVRKPFLSGKYPLDALGVGRTTMKVSTCARNMVVWPHYYNVPHAGVTKETRIRHLQECVRQVICNKNLLN